MLPLLIGLGVLIGGVLIVANWDEIINWLDDFIPKLKNAWEQVRPNVPHAAMIVGDTIIEGAETMVRVMHKLYYREDGEWIEETTTRKVAEEEVPDFILQKVQSQAADITKEVEMQLSCKV